ncbi:MAG: hypothetical protein K6U11_12500 [bacterium]|nr:hypothetical protein [bacterium]
MPKRFLIIAVLSGSVPLLVVITFSIFYLSARSRVAERGNVRNSLTTQELFCPDWVWALESALLKLAEDPQLREYLTQAERSLSTEKSQPLVNEQKIVFQHIERFQNQHPAFEEIALKNPQTGGKYLSIPATALGENYIGVRLLITVPIKSSEQTAAPSALLQGFVNLKQLNQPPTSSAGGESKSAGVESKSAAVADSTGNPSDLTTTRKIARVFVLILIFIIISIPTTMFLFYRKMKRVLNPSAEPPPSSPSYASAAHEPRPRHSALKRRNKK